MFVESLLVAPLSNVFYKRFILTIRGLPQEGMCQGSSSGGTLGLGCADSDYV